jgi:hypothetical protein
VTTDGVRIGELDLLTTYTHHSHLQVITALSLISTLTNHYTLSLFPACLQQSFPSNGFLQWWFFSFPCSCRYCPANIPQLNSLRQPEVLGADPTENTVSNSFSIVMGGCLAIARISFPRECVYRVRLHGVTTQNRVLYIVIVIKNSNPFQDAATNWDFGVEQYKH